MNSNRLICGGWYASKIYSYFIIVVFPTKVINEYGIQTYIGKQREHTPRIDWITKQ